MYEVEQILAKSKAARWSYSKTFQALKDVGVKSYAVSLLGGYKAIYQGSFGSWNEAAPAGYQDVKVDKKFYPSEVQAAIMKHTQKKTSYLEFLVDIAAAGVTFYEVDIQNEMISYFNSSQSWSYQDVVPVLAAVEGVNVEFVFKEAGGYW